MPSPKVSPSSRPPRSPKARPDLPPSLTKFLEQAFATPARNDLPSPTTPIHAVPSDTPTPPPSVPSAPRAAVPLPSPSASSAPAPEVLPESHEWETARQAFLAFEALTLTDGPSVYLAALRQWAIAFPALRSLDALDQWMALWHPDPVITRRWLALATLLFS